MGMNKELVIFLLLTLTTLVRSLPTNYETNYAPAHEYKEDDYSFSYGVKDLHTGDVKSQWEKKVGDVVTGRYSMIEADGSIRTVEYSADKYNGFTAVVKHDGPSHHPLLPNKPSSQQGVNIKHAALRPEQQNVYTSANTAFDQTFQLSESKPSVLSHLYETTRKIPQPKANCHTCSLKDFKVSQIDQEGAHTFRPSVQIRHARPPGPSANLKKNRPFPKLPIDLTLLEGSEKVIPVDISEINPVEINLTEDTGSKLGGQFETIQSSPQPAREPLGKYLQGYDKLSEPVVESDFKPISTSPRSATTKPNAPNTFKSGKKPVSTPGLRHYSTQIKGRPIVSSLKRVKTKTYPSIHSQIVPIIFAKHLADANKDSLQKAQISRLHPTVTNNGFLRYAKHVRIVEEDN